MLLAAWFLCISFVDEACAVAALPVPKRPGVGGQSSGGGGGGGGGKRGGKSGGGRNAGKTSVKKGSQSGGVGRPGGDASAIVATGSGSHCRDCHCL